MAYPILTQKWQIVPIRFRLPFLFLKYSGVLFFFQALMNIFYTLAKNNVNLNFDFL